VGAKIVGRRYKGDTKHVKGYDENRKRIKSKIKTMGAVVGVILMLMMFGVMFFGIFKLMTRDD